MDTSINISELLTAEQQLRVGFGTGCDNCFYATWKSSPCGKCGDTYKFIAFKQEVREALRSIVNGIVTKEK